MSLRDAAVVLTEHSYPATTEELAEDHGDFVLNLPNGEERLDAVFARAGEERFESAEEAVAALYAGVSDKAVGRVGYSDRDSTPIGTFGPDQVSF